MKNRLPKVGIYIFMHAKVLTTILSFFGSYFCHFLGYAVAFHLVMPREEEGEEEGSFSTLGNSIIKVLFCST